MTPDITSSLILSMVFVVPYTANFLWLLLITPKFVESVNKCVEHIKNINNGAGEVQYPPTISVSDPKVVATGAKVSVTVGSNNLSCSK